MKRPLFVRWALVNIIAFCILGLALYYGQTQLNQLSVVGKIMAGIILIVYFLATVYAATLCWRIDTTLEKTLDSKKLSWLRHRAEHIAYTANELPYIGLLGAITGIFFFFTTNLHASDTAHLKEAIDLAMSNLGIAFVPTITGIYFRIILNWQHHMAEHAIKGARFTATRKKNPVPVYTGNMAESEAKCLNALSRS